MFLSEELDFRGGSLMLYIPFIRRFCYVLHYFILSSIKWKYPEDNLFSI
jgi:hypothetical protein